MSVITQTKLEFTKVGSRIGAEIRGLDLNGDLSQDTVAQIRAALNEHKALVFREANILTDEAQVKFASHFGPLTKAHPTVASVEGEENVLPVDSENGSANNWHTDVTRGKSAAGIDAAEHRPAGLRRRDPHCLLGRGVPRLA